MVRMTHPHIHRYNHCILHKQQTLNPRWFVKVFASLDEARNKGHVNDPYHCTHSKKLKVKWPTTKDLKKKSLYHHEIHSRPCIICHKYSSKSSQIVCLLLPFNKFFIDLLQGVLTPILLLFLCYFLVNKFFWRICQIISYKHNLF